MTILILGGNRFVGKLLAEASIKLNHEVTVFNRKGTGPEGCHIIKGDRNNLEDLECIELNPGKMILETLRTHMSDIYDRITCPEITNILHLSI